MPRPPIRIGERSFVVLGGHSFGGGPGGAFRYLSRFIPFRLHLLDLEGFERKEAAYKLYQHLAKQRLEWQFLAVAIVEENCEPTVEHALEVEDYLRNLDQLAAMESRNKSLGNLLQRMVTDPGGGSPLHLMQKWDVSRQ